MVLCTHVPGMCSHLQLREPERCVLVMLVNDVSSKPTCTCSVPQGLIAVARFAEGRLWCRDKMGWRQTGWLKELNKGVTLGVGLRLPRPLAQLTNTSRIAS